MDATHYVLILEAILGALGLAFLAFFTHEAKHARESIIELNLNIVKILEKVTRHDVQIENHEDRILTIETNNLGDKPWQESNKSKKSSRLSAK